MGRIAERHTGDAGDQADYQKLERKQAKDVGLRQAEASHHRARVQMAQRKAARRGRNRNGGNHRRQQGDQRKEALGPIERALHLGSPAFERLDALAALQAFLHGIRIAPAPQAARRRPAADT